MTLIRYNPLNEVSLFRNNFGRFFNDSFCTNQLASQKTDQEKEWQPIVDIIKKDKKVVVTAELPGINKEDISIDVNEDVLTLKGERKYENKVKEADFYRKERFSGSFSRSFVLPAGVSTEDINAEYKDGILTIEIPEAEKEEVKQITIN
ncbi:MAG: Hsp20/alpha crystallin family protein [Desulfobacteraceae bacterium]|nr:Hsp20/alpha crystallin family protein [Desulfobacteraceae bacterium]